MNIKPETAIARITNAVASLDASNARKLRLIATHLESGKIDVTAIRGRLQKVIDGTDIQADIDVMAGLFPTPGRKPAAIAAVDARKVAAKSALKKPTTTKVDTVPANAEVDGYDRVQDLLDANGVKSRVDHGLATTLKFNASGYDYQIWSPNWNANGPDAGWVIAYSDDPDNAPGANSDDYADVDLPDHNAVNAWLTEDLGFTKKVRYGKGPTKSGRVAVKSNATPMVTSHLVTVVSNADSALKLAQDGKLNKVTIDAIRDLRDAADALRKTLV